MQFLGHLIVRLVPIVTGLVLAFVGAGVFLGFGFYSEMIDPVFQPDAGTPASGVIVFLLAVLWSPFIAAAAIGPAAVLIVLAEWLRLRGLVSNVVLGGLAALLAFWIHFDLAPGMKLSDGTLVVVAATGFIAGFFYWLVAGRSAGKWLDRP